MPATTSKSYYEELGLSRNADQKAIRAAFRKLARKHHPDANRGDPAAEERFKSINEANEVLSDPASRKLYDRYGADWTRYRDAGFTGEEPAGDPLGATRPRMQERRSSSQPGGSVTFESFDGDGEFGDIFHSLFGRGRGPDRASSQRASRRKGEDLSVEADISFDEAFRGTTRRVDVEVPSACTTCGGTGFVRNAPCPTCDGTGIVHKARTLEVTIPAGVRSGARIRVAGQGGPGSGGGPNGDVFLVVRVRPNDAFEREGDNLRTDIETSLYTAMLGGEAVVATPTGKVALAIPAGSQPGRVFRLRGQGMPLMSGAKGQRGDLLARLTVAIPTNLTAEERALVEQLRDLRGRPDAAGR